MVLKDLMKDRTIQLSIAAGLMGGALSYWFQPYNERLLLGVDIFLLMGILAFLASLGIGLARRAHWFQIAVFLCAGFVVSSSLLPWPEVWSPISLTGGGNEWPVVRMMEFTGLKSYLYGSTRP